MLNKKNKTYIIIFAVLMLSISIGYALIYTTLKVDNNIVIKGFKSKKLYDFMMVNSAPDNTSSTYVSSASGISFGTVASDTNGKGLYMDADTADDDYPVYYYRGKIDNNHLIFAGFCWKIVRTTNTGGVKIIYNGVPADDGSCNNTEDASEIATSPYNIIENTSMADMGYMYGTRYETTSTSMTGKKYVYGQTVSYSNGTYTLNTVYSPTLGWGMTYTTIRSKGHYTCMSTSTTCTSVYYMHNIGISSAYHIVLTNGKLLNQAILEMSTQSSNENDSTIKTVVDNWYKENLLSYDSKIEDTVYCNDRGIYQYNTWDETDTGTSDMHFNGYYRNFITYNPTTDCPQNDSFTKSTTLGNGKLTYPIGLLTADELILAGGGANDYMNSGKSVWTMTPGTFGNTGGGARNYSFNIVLESVSPINSEFSVRPVISLKSGTEYTSGDGSVTTPFIVE